MIDLDQLKAAGLNSDRQSRRLLSSHEATESDRLRDDLWSAWCLENPHATAGEIAAFEASLPSPAVVTGRRAA